RRVVDASTTIRLCAFAPLRSVPGAQELPAPVLGPSPRALDRFSLAGQVMTLPGVGGSDPKNRQPPRPPRPCGHANGMVDGMSTATRVLPGRASLKSWSRLGFSSTPRYEIPVMVPPGRARLWTMPTATGSDTPANTIGMSRIGDQKVGARDI